MLASPPIRRFRWDRGTRDCWRLGLGAWRARVTDADAAKFVTLRRVADTDAAELMALRR
jgi:hypothetical protein